MALPRVDGARREKGLAALERGGSGGNPFSGPTGSDANGPAPPKGGRAEDRAREDRHPLPSRGDGGGEGQLPPGEPLRGPRREDRDAIQRAPPAGVQAAVLPEVPRVPRPREELPGARGPRQGDDDVRGVRGRPAVPVRAGAAGEAGPGSVARRHVNLPRLAGHVLPEFEDTQGQQEEDQARCEEEGEDRDGAEEPEPGVNRVRR